MITTIQTRKLVPLLFFLLFLLPGLIAQEARIGAGFDLGATIEQNTVVDLSPDDGVSATNSTTLRLFWILEVGDWAINLRGSVGADFPFYPGEDISPLGINFGLSTLSAAATFGLDSDPTFQALNLQFGRISVSDYLGTYLSQAMDGFSLGVTGNSAELGVYLGYTGFLFKSETNFSFTPSDSADDSNDSIVFAPPRMLLGLSGAFKNESQSFIFGIDGILQADLRQLISSDRLIPSGATAASGSQDGGLYTTFALTPTFRLTFGPRVFWDTQGVLQTGTTQAKGTTYQTEAIVAGSALTRLLWFPSNAHRLLFQVQWSSGDGSYRDTYEEGATLTGAREILYLYKAPTAPSTGTIFAPKPGNLTWLTIQWSGKPFTKSPGAFGQGTSMNAGVYTFLRNTAGPISDSRASASVANPYMGTEVTLGLNVRPFSDLGLGINGGLYLPPAFAGGAMEGNAPLVEGKISGFFSLRM